MFRKSVSGFSIRTRSRPSGNIAVEKKAAKLGFPLPKAGVSKGPRFSLPIKPDKQRPPLFSRQSHPMLAFSRCLSTSLALGLFSAASLPAFADHGFDGAYRIDVTTDVGDCAPTMTGTLTIDDGLFVSSDVGSVKAFGRIGADGVVSFAFHRGSDIAHVSGRLKGSRGQGAWSAPIQQCGGRWTATKLK